MGLPLNSAQAPNFGTWELKIVPLKKVKDGRLAVKETMAITMIDPGHVARTPFESSHLLNKLNKAVLCARLFESKEERASILVKVATFDLEDKNIFSQVKKDYDETRDKILIRVC